MRKIVVFLLLLIAPLIGVVAGIASANPSLYTIEVSRLFIPAEILDDEIISLELILEEVQENIGFIEDSINEQREQYRLQQQVLQELVKKSQEQKKLSEAIYEQRILEKLGDPIDVFESENVQVMVFEVREKGYRGYIAKVKLHNPEVIRVTLSDGRGETTKEAVERTGAVLGINGGGFFTAVENGEVKKVPIGNTMIEGELVRGFIPTYENLFFVGFTKEGELVGGNYITEEELVDKKPWQGVSFVPVLLKDSKPEPIPEKWQHEKHPRTILGQYANGDLIFIVIDGRQAGWSNGISLEQMQIKLLQLMVVDAYNLDGGGSSTFVYKGKVLNRPSDGKPRKVVTNIVVLP